MANRPTHRYRTTKEPTAHNFIGLIVFFGTMIVVFGVGATLLASVWPVAVFLMAVSIAAAAQKINRIRRGDWSP